MYQSQLNLMESQSGPDAFNELRFLMTFLTILGVMQKTTPLGH